MSLRLERDGPVATLLIDRPERRNAFSQAMWEAMAALLDEVAADASVRLLLLRSAADGIFSAGADIAELSRLADDPDWRAVNQRTIAGVLDRLAHLPRPVVAFIDGDCVGGGCGLAVASDLRVATPRARFGITPARLGLVYPLSDTKRLVDLVGPARAKRLLFSGRLIDAEEALRIGLVDEIAASPDELAAALASASPHSLTQSKAVIQRIVDGQEQEDDWSRAAVAQAFALPDFREGVAAFLDKRPPRFR